LKYDEENNQIDAKTIYSHPDQIWAIEPSPTDRSLVVTSSQRRDGTHDVSLFKLSAETGDDENIHEDNNQSYDNDLKDLDRLSRFSFQSDQNFVQSIKWHSSRDTILTLDSLNLSIWTLREAGVSVCILNLFFSLC
jgi:WD40 repeat protein